MSELSKGYEPQLVEKKWYAAWMEQGCFTANPASAKLAYSIVIPPPNVTGVLTMGHVLNNTIQDILARKARMDGREVLWLPGTDHAGIATQNAVEKSLKKAGEIRHRDDLGREAMVAKIWEWKEKYGGIILEQLRALGASCDWTRTRFTMDPEYSRCVQRVFVDLYRKGAIYRGKRMVNWCPASLTALSDEEVTMKEQKGFLYHFRVEVAEQPGTFLSIATTRPETIPGDTAVAVNPKDPRYLHLIGQHVIRALPLDQPTEMRRIPIIGDEHVDFAFGTGVLKVTPAHDKADYEIGQRHKLAILDVLTPDGKMTAAAGVDLVGLDRFAARKKAVEILEATGAMEKVEPYVNNVGFSERADVPIEPRLSEQWFLKYPSVEVSRSCVAPPGEAGSGDVGGITGGTGALGDEVVRGVPGQWPGTTGQWPVPPSHLAFPLGKGNIASGQKMRFFPERWAKVYDHWMGGIQDWCISRQLWWGHRIPVWTRAYDADAEMPEIVREAVLRDLDQPSVSKKSGGWSHFRAEKIAGAWIVSAATYFDEESMALENLGFIQDPDVLDTWFSSWLWPFATMGWTGDKKTDAQNPTLQRFYPATDLVTGPDIIFFWVARMIMAGYEYMGELPFRNVYFTGIIRDKQGRKMSKSLGNSPDPLDLIAQYGADALRFGVMRSAPLGQDILFDEQAVELGRNFCNKLWNACRFRQLMSDGVVAEVQGEINPTLLTADDRWILRRLDQALGELKTAFTEYRFSDATATLYRVFWAEYCDWYLEASKAAFQSDDGKLKANKLAVIDFVLSHLLRMFHPFVPFITEELWHGMGFATEMPAEQGGRTIMFAAWPKPFSPQEIEYFGLDDNADKVAQAKYDLVSLGRGLRRDCKIDPARKVRFILRPAGQLGSVEAEVLRLLLNAESIEMVPADWSPAKGTPSASNALGDLYLPLAGLIDYAAERVRLSKELEKARGEEGKVAEKLANPAFALKVPAKVLADHQQRVADWQAKVKQIEASLADLPES